MQPRRLNKKIFWDLYFYLIGKSKEFKPEHLTPADIHQILKSIDKLTKYSPKLSFLFNFVNSILHNRKANNFGEENNDEILLVKYFLEIIRTVKQILENTNTQFLGVSKKDFITDEEISLLYEVISKLATNYEKHKKVINDLIYLFNFSDKFKGDVLKVTGITYGVYCLNCPLFEIGLETVPYEIWRPDDKQNVNPRIMFIGINPGKEEREQKRPFVGKSGRILRSYISQYLEKNNIPYIITNQIKCSTDNTTQLKNSVFNIGDVNITLPLIYDKYCSNYIIEEIETFNPEIIVTVGKDAHELLLNNQKISELIKSKGIKIYTIRHPSYYVRKGKKEGDEIPEYKKVFKEITNKFINLPSDGNNTSNEPLYREIKSIDEIPEEYLLLNINILEKENKYLIVVSHKDTGEIRYYKLPFEHEFYISPRPLYIENDYIEPQERLKKVKVTDYIQYRNLMTQKRKELTDIIGRPYSEKGKQILEQIMKNF